LKENNELLKQGSSEEANKKIIKNSKKVIENSNKITGKKPLENEKKASPKIERRRDGSTTIKTRKFSLHLPKDASSRPVLRFIG
jgi:hypothetical protein